MQKKNEMSDGFNKLSNIFQNHNNKKTLSIPTQLNKQHHMGPGPHQSYHSNAQINRTIVREPYISRSWEKSKNISTIFKRRSYTPDHDDNYYVSSKNNTEKNTKSKREMNDFKPYDAMMYC